MMANPILDKITKLNAEIEQLRAENSHLRRVGVDGIPAEVLALQAAALADLRAENERLRARVEELERDARAPRPPEELVEALQDRIHPTSGRLLSAAPLRVSKEASP